MKKRENVNLDDQGNVHRAEVIREELFERGARFSAIYVKLKNACLMFLSEGEDRLGTLAAAIPSSEGVIGPSISSILLGSRDTIVARALAERLAGITRKMALVSISLKTMRDVEAASTLAKLFDKVLKDGG